MNNLKGTILITLVLGLTLAAGACGKKGPVSETAAENEPRTAAADKPEISPEAEPKTSEENTEVRQIVVGTGNAFNPLCYLDEKGNLTGFEYEFLKKVDEVPPPV